MKHNYTVYLAGAMEYTSDHGAGWRDEVTKKLKEWSIKVFNPASNEHGILEKMGATSPADFLAWKHTDFPRFRECMREIINFDMDAIDELHSMLVYVTRGLQGGTIGELTHAYRNLNIPVIAVLEPGLKVTDVSGWVLGCLDEIHTNWDDAIESIQRDKEQTL